MTRALVTGVSGQDGSYLAERLIAEDVEVHALALAGDPPVPGVEMHRGDVADLHQTRRLVLDLAPDEIYNLAAISSVARSWSEPDVTAAVNGAAAAALLESALQVQQRADKLVRFAQASSAEMFGVPDRSPQDENTPLRPVNPYGAAKAFAHLMVGVYRQHGLHASGLVLYNHESPRRPPGFVSRRITAGAAAIAAGLADRLTLGNLDATRDFGWAPDYVDAMVRAARSGEAQDFVVATGESRAVRDFVAEAFACVGIDDWARYVETDPGLLRPADATGLAGDATRARDRLGWAPTVSFEELVSRMVEADVELAQSAARSSSSPSR